MGTRKVKRLHLENKITTMVMYVDVNFIYCHTFVLGIREDGKQRGIGLGDGPYSISTNSTSFYVSAMSDTVFTRISAAVLF